MKKSLFFLIALIMIVLVSCSPDVFSHEGQKVTVMVVGLDYAVRYNAVDYLKYKELANEPKMVRVGSTDSLPHPNNNKKKGCC